MRNATHEAVGAAGAVALCAVAAADILTTGGSIAASVLGSRLPDADQFGAKIYRRSRLERRDPVVGALGLAFKALLLPVSLLRHRGATHWLLTAAVVTALYTAIAAAISDAAVFPVASGVGAGYVLHLLADACTPHGAPLLGPFSKRKVHLLPNGHRIATGSAGDLTVRAGAICVGAAIVIASGVLTV